MNFEDKGGNGGNYPKPRAGYHEGIIRAVEYLGETDFKDNGNFRDWIMVVIQLDEKQPHSLLDGTPNEASGESFYFTHKLMVSFSTNSAGVKSGFLKYHEAATGMQTTQGGKAIPNLAKQINTEQWINKRVGITISFDDKGYPHMDAVSQPNQSVQMVADTIPSYIYGKVIPKAMSNMKRPANGQAISENQRNTNDQSDYNSPGFGQSSQNTDTIPF